MTGTFAALALLSLGRGLISRLDLQYGRLRTLFDQWLIRGCWVLVAALFVVAALLHDPTQDSMRDELSLLIFLVCCGALLEFSGLVIYRARLEEDVRGRTTLVCRHPLLGELTLGPEDIELLFTLRSGPDGLSYHAWLGPRRRGHARTPRFDVAQVVLRMRGRSPLKYLVLCETSSSARAAAIARAAAQALAIPLLDGRPPTPSGVEDLSGQGRPIADTPLPPTLENQDPEPAAQDSQASP